MNTEQDILKNVDINCRNKSTIEDNGCISAVDLHLCSAEERTQTGGLYDGRMITFRCTVPLRAIEEEDAGFPVETRI